MKRLLIMPGMVLLLLSACSSYGKVKVDYDSFTKSTVATLKTKHREKGKLFRARTIILNFHQEVKNGKLVKARVSVRLPLSLLEDDLSERAFLSLDGKNIELAFNKISSRQITRTTSHTTYSGGHTGGTHNAANQHGMASTRTHTVNFKLAQGNLELNQEQIQKLAKANQIALRVYAGDKPFTFDFSEKYVFAVNDFASITGKAAP